MSNPNGPRTGRPPARAEQGMIATSHSLASATGLRVLQGGGSAIDAAIASDAVLGVVYPHMAGLGGDGFMLIHAPQEGRIRALNASGPAAERATIDYYRERGFADRMPSRGPLAALTVPGVVEGWRAAHAEYGRLAWSELFTDAIGYARRGMPISRSLTEWIERDRELFAHHPSAARLFLRQGREVRLEGERLLQPELALSLEELARRGARDGFYEGELATRICASLAPAGSPLRPEDFARFHAEWTSPISARYRDCTVYQIPPNTQGFAALQILQLLDGFDVSCWSDTSADYYHHLAEAVKLAFADSDAWLTDPAFVQIPLDRLLAEEYMNQRRALIRSEEALVMEEVEPGIPFPGSRARTAPGGGTCYSCVIDAEGLAVSTIQSIYHDFGSAEVAGDTGILLQNRGSFFALEEEHPNRLEPGKRSFHTLVPGMVFRDDEPYLLYGSMGGEGQPQTGAALITRIIDFGYDVQQAIEAPRSLLGRTWGVQTRTLSLESRIPDPIFRELRRRGQPVTMVQQWDESMGHAQAIRIDRERGFLEGGADPRGDGVALGY